MCSKAARFYREFAADLIAKSGLAAGQQLTVEEVDIDDGACGEGLVLWITLRSDTGERFKVTPGDVIYDPREDDV